MIKMILWFWDVLPVTQGDQPCLLYISASVFPFVHYHENCDSETESTDKGNSCWWQGVGASSVFMFVLKDQRSHGKAGLFFSFNVISSYSKIHYFKWKKEVILILGICWYFSKRVTAFSCYCLFWHYLTLELSIIHSRACLYTHSLVWLYME